MAATSSSVTAGTGVGALHQDRHALSTLFSFIETKERVLTIGRVCHLWLKYSADPIAWSQDSYVLRIHPSPPFPDEIPTRYRSVIRRIYCECGRLSALIKSVIQVGQVETRRMIESLAQFTNLTELKLSDRRTPTAVMTEIAEFLSQLPAPSHRSIRNLTIGLIKKQAHQLSALFSAPIFARVEHLDVIHLEDAQIESIAQLQHLRHLRIVAAPISLLSEQPEGRLGRQAKQSRLLWDVVHRLPLLDTLIIESPDPCSTRPLPSTLTSLTLTLNEIMVDLSNVFEFLDSPTHATLPPQLRQVILNIDYLNEGLMCLKRLFTHACRLVTLELIEIRSVHFSVLEAREFHWYLSEFVRLNASHLVFKEAHLLENDWNSIRLRLTRPFQTEEDERDSINSRLHLSPPTPSPAPVMTTFDPNDSSYFYLDSFVFSTPLHLFSLISLRLHGVVFNASLMASFIQLPSTQLEYLSIKPRDTSLWEVLSTKEQCQQFWAAIGRQTRLHVLELKHFCFGYARPTLPTETGIEAALAQLQQLHTFTYNDDEYSVLKTFISFITKSAGHTLAQLPNLTSLTVPLPPDPSSFIWSVLESSTINTFSFSGYHHHVVYCRRNMVDKWFEFNQRLRERVAPHFSWKGGNCLVGKRKNQPPATHRP